MTSSLKTNRFGDINMKIVITIANFCDDALNYLKDKGFDVHHYSGPSLGAGVADDTLFEVVKDADVIIAGTETYRPSLLARLPKLKLISRNGIGYDAIDQEGLKTNGIGLTRTRGFVEGAVAEQIMAYILYFARRIDQQNALMHAHQWKSKLEPGAKNHTLGLVGFGGIGTETAKRAVPFGMKVLYYCRHPNPQEPTCGAEYAELDELLAQSDYVAACVPLTDETYHFFDAKKIAKMKKGACLINIARGPVVDEHALADSLKSGHLSSCAVDVYPKEPCTDSPLADCPTAVLTPHTASSTVENMREMNFAAADNVINYLNGALDPKYLVVQGSRA